MPKIIFAHRSDKSTGAELINTYAQSTRGENEESEYVVQVCAGSRHVSAVRFERLQPFNGTLYGITPEGFLYSDAYTPTPVQRTFTALAPATDGFYSCATRRHLVWGAVGGPPNAIDQSNTPQPVDLTEPIGSVTTIADSVVYAVHNSDQFWVSDTNDAVNIGDLAFATAQVRDDAIKRVVTVGEQVIFLGADTQERWYVSGAPIMPLAKYANAVSENGILHANAVCHIPNALAWVSKDKQVMLGVGASAKIVSTRSIHEYLEKSSSEGIALFSYSLFGRWFVAMTFDGYTLEYDVSEGLWHTRWSPGLMHWLPTQAVSFDGSVYWPHEDGVAVMDTSLATEFGVTPTISLQSAPIGTYESVADVLDYVMFNFDGFTEPFTMNLRVEGDKAELSRETPIEPDVRTVLRQFGSARQFTITAEINPTDRPYLRSTFAQLGAGRAG